MTFDKLRKNKNVFNLINYLTLAVLILTKENN